MQLCATAIDVRGRHQNWLLLACIVTALSACSTRTVLRPTANPATSWQQITPPDAPHYNLQPGQSASLPAPQIGRFAPPLYPPTLAHPGMPPVTVKAQLVFDANGKVSGVYVLSNSYAGAGHALFEEAVRAAANDWAFTPLVFTETHGGGAAPVTLTRKAKPFSLWFAFHFDMVDGKPVVETVKR